VFKGAMHPGAATILHYVVPGGMVLEVQPKCARAKKERVAQILELCYNHQYFW